MADLPKEILAEKENVKKALNNLSEAIAREEKSIIELSAMATFLHNIYNGIENILKQVFKIKGIELPKSETWHKDLLNASVSFGILSEGLSDELFEYLAFRHFFVHAYGFMLDETQLEELSNNIYKVWAQFLLAIETIATR
jgi:uncharacterized protein YutE (UPF0331/DUF86 family)